MIQQNLSFVNLQAKESMWSAKETLEKGYISYGKGR